MQFTKKYIDALSETLYFATHKTGLRIFVVPKKGFSKTYAIYGTKFGSINNTFIPLGENKEITVPDGVAHFLEHKVFEQPDGGNAPQTFAKTGASPNAFTSKTMTAYHFSGTEKFMHNLEILLDFVTHPYFSAVCHHHFRHKV